MTDSKKSKRSLLERFSIVDEIVPLEGDETDEILQSAKVDKEGAIARLMAHANQMAKEARNREYEDAAARRSAILARLEANPAAKDRASIVARVKHLRARGIEVQAMYQNLEALTDEDLESLVAELELLASDDEEA